MTDATLIADLIRAGLAPELVQRVVDEFDRRAATRSDTAATRNDTARHEMTRNDVSNDTKRHENDTASDTARHGPMSNAERCRRYRARRDARKNPDIASDNGDAGETAETHNESPTRERVTTRVATQGVFLLPILSSSYESIQGKEGSKERMHARARGDPAFDHFWERYPHKVGKRDALKCFERVKQSGTVTFEALMEGLERYRRKTDDRPWCNPSTWLNQGRWEDVPNEVNSNGKSISGLLERARGISGGNAANYVPGSAGPGSKRLDTGQGPPDLFKLSKG